MHNKMKAKIITKEKAISLGLSTPSVQSGRGASKYMYGVIGKLDSNGKKENKIHQAFRIDVKTNKKEILFETKEYKKIRTNLHK